MCRNGLSFRRAYSANGLTDRARAARVRERKARRREARAEGGWGWVAWLWSVLSQVFTRYGIQLRWVLEMILLLYLGSTLVYVEFGGMTLTDSLYYSIVTFTTSPPAEPTGIGMHLGNETFAGTAIVFLDYALGTRKRV